MDWSWSHSGPKPPPPSAKGAVVVATSVSRRLDRSSPDHSDCEPQGTYERSDGESPPDDLEDDLLRATARVFAHRLGGRAHLTEATGVIDAFLTEHLPVR